MSLNFYKAFFLIVVSSIIFILLKNLLPKNILDQNNEKISEHIVQDSLMIKLIAEEKLLAIEDSLSILKIDSSLLKVEYKSRLLMIDFYKKLLNLKEKKKENIRIAYFGDSMNDGDLIVQDLRKLFQQEYGGKGVGFVNLISESARSRGSVRHNFSDNWNFFSFLKTSKNFPLGVSGTVSLANDTTDTDKWVEYGVSFVPQTSYLYQPTLFYGKADSTSFISFESDGTIKKLALVGVKNLNTLKVHSGNLSKLKIHFNTNNTAIFGLNFDNKDGIHIDNFSTRGNSGLALSSLRSNLMHQFQKELDYDLIILQFGTNIISKKKSNYKWYSRAMKRVIKHLNIAFPNVEILVLSVADKSRKYDVEMITDSSIYNILKVQDEFSKDSKVSFISLYQLMGGENSMVDWVEKKPVKARKDYTHFNITGSKEIAQLIYNEIDSGFKLFQNNSLIIKDSTELKKENESSIK